MKKNMIALAVAGALVAPVAMAEVSISGGLQAELVQVGGDAASENGLYMNDGMTGGTANSGNFGYLAFAASEDLGGGLKALARYSMNVKGGEDGITTRDSYVGLSGGFGTVLAGRMSHPYKTSTVGWDPMVATSFQARGNGGMGGSQGLGLGGEGFLYGSEVSNTVAYANSFAGGMVKLVAGVILDEAVKLPDATNDKTNGKHAKSASLTISPMSGLDLVIAWADLSEYANVFADKSSATKVGAKYSAGAVTVAAQVEMAGEGFSAAGEKFNMYFLTGSFKMDDANSISASYGRTGSDAYGAGAEDAGYMGVGFNHAFSKNTNALIAYRKSTDMAGIDGNDESAVGVNMRVKF